MVHTPTGITYTWEELSAENKKHEQEGAINFLFGMLVPTFGPAATTAGEAVRAFCKVNYRFFNDGDMAGGNDTTGGSSVNAPWRYLRDEVGAKSPEVRQCAEVLGEYVGDRPFYEETLQALGSALLEFISKNPSMMTEKNDKDSVCGDEYERPWDYKCDADY